MIKKHPIRLVAALIFMLSLGVYWATANPKPSGYADSDELITVAHQFAVAHPPGYGLNVILVGIIEHLFYFMSPAYAANLFAGFLSSLTLVLLYLSTIKIIQQLQPRSQFDYGSLGSIAVGILILGFAGFFWLYSTFIEVMALGNVFTALTIYCSLSWLTAAAHRQKYFIATALSWGFGVSHLQSLILLAPGLLYLFLAFDQSGQKLLLYRVKRLMLALSLAGIAFVIGNLLILPLNAHQPSFTWDFPATVSGWWSMVSRQDYQGTILDRNVTVSNAYLGLPQADQLRAIPLYLRFLWNQFAGLPLLIVLAGIIYLVKAHRSLAIGLLLFYIIAGFLFSVYVTPVNFPADSLDVRLTTGVSERQYLIGFTILGLFSGLGLYAVYMFLRQLIQCPSYRRLATSSLLVFPLVAVLYANWSLGNQRPNSAVYDYIRNLLDSAEPNSVIICTGDISCFGLYYQNLVENYRPDVTILSKIPRARHYFLTQNPQYIGYEYRDTPFFFAQEISWNSALRPTYITTVDDFYIKYLALDGEAFYVVPRGNLFQIQRTYPTSLPPLGQDWMADRYLAKESDFRNDYYCGLADYFSSIYQKKVYLYIKYKDKQAAHTAINYALTFHQTPLMIGWLSNLDALIAAGAYTPTAAPHNYLAEAKSLLEQHEIEKAYEAARIAAYLHPFSAEPLEFLKQLYFRNNYPDNVKSTEDHLTALKSFPQFTAR